MRTGLSDLPVNVPANLCGAGTPGFSGTIDDLMIEASIEAIDGPGGVLGSAGPCITRGFGGLPIYGAMRFDSADVAGLEANGRLETVILHEMGHVLGIGTVWGSRLTGAGTTNPVFTAWPLVAHGTPSSGEAANRSRLRTPAARAPRMHTGASPCSATSS